MGLLFLNFAQDIKHLSNNLFNVIGLPEPNEGDSSNVYKGIYFYTNLLGIKIKLEYNSYDYEVDYEYMITVDRDIVSTIKVRADDIESFTKIVANILSSTMGIQIAREVGDKLQIHSPVNGE